MIGGSDLRPAWQRNNLAEPPAGTRTWDRGSKVYTIEQQRRLGVNEMGEKVSTPATSEPESPAAAWLLETAYKNFDADGDGFITTTELCSFFGSLSHSNGFAYAREKACTPGRCKW